MSPSRDHEKEVRHLFTEASDDYAALFREERRGANYCFRKRLELSQEMTKDVVGSLLDVACGPGQITKAILDSGNFDRAMLIDIAPEMLRRARHHMASTGEDLPKVRVDFLEGSVFDLMETLSERFNLIMVLGLIAHTGRLDALLNGLGRVLAEGGAILLQSTLVDHPGTKLIRAATKERHFRKFGYYSSYYTIRDIQQACARQGLEVVSFRRFGLGLPWGDKLWARGNHFMEILAETWTARIGSEGLFLLKHAQARNSNSADRGSRD